MTKKVAPVKMNVQYKKMWLKALRSGVYAQGDGALYIAGDADVYNKATKRFITRERYCCLGVLYHCVTNKRPLQEKQYLAEIMEKRVGLNAEIQRKLAIMNDQRNWKFPTIANWIEKNL